MSPLALADAESYVAGAYMVFVVLLLVYVAIMAAKLQRIQRELRELADIADPQTSSSKVTSSSKLERGGSGTA